MKLLAYVQALTLVVRVVDQNSFRLLKADCNQNKTYAIIQTQDPNLAKFLANAPSYIEYLLGLTASQDSVSLYSTTKESHGIG